MGLHVAGVDLVETQTGPKILEVNASPGLEGIERASGIDVASAIVAYAERFVTRWKASGSKTASQSMWFEDAEGFARTHAGGL